MKLFSLLWMFLRMKDLLLFYSVSWLLVSGLSLSFSSFFVGSGLGVDFLSSLPALGTEKAGVGSFLTDSEDFFMAAYSALADKLIVLFSAGLEKKP